MKLENLLDLKNIRESLEYLKQYQNKIVYLSYSGGKDSTALLGLFLLFKKLDLINFKKLEVNHSNTLMEMPYINMTVEKVMKICRENEVKFNFLTPQLSDRFFYNVIGRGVAIPNRKFRWCTDRLKIKPIQSYIKSRNHQNDFYQATGERMGESKKRDKKLKDEQNSCDNSGNECGVKDIAIVSENVIRPIINWSECQVWDFIALCDVVEILPGVSEILKDGYSLNRTEDGSLRTGCVGCPLVNVDKSLKKYSEEYPTFSPLNRISEIYKELRLKENRILHHTTGKPRSIKLSVRIKYWKEILDIEKQVKKHNPTFQLIDPIERINISVLLTKGTYPKGYKKFHPED